MLHKAARRGERHAGRVHREPGKIPAAALGLPLHAHAHPHIGEQHLRAAGGLVRVLHQPEPVAVPPRQQQHIRRRAVPLGAGRRQAHPCRQAAHNEGVGHVVAVPDKARLHTVQTVQALPHRHQVGQHLQGVGVVRHTGDHRHPAVPGQRFQIALLVGAADDGVIVPPQHAGGVLDGLAPCGLQIGGAQVGAQAPQLVDAHLQAGAGAGGVFGEQQRHCLALQQSGVAAFFVQALGLVRHIQHVEQLFFCQVGEFQQVFHSSVLFQNVLENCQRGVHIRLA